MNSHHESSKGSRTNGVSSSDHSQTTERFIIELQSVGTDFHTVFKNQQVALNTDKNLLIQSIVTNLSIRGFSLKDQVISYFSRSHQCFVAVAKRPIPHDAIIPAKDCERSGRLSLKMWPPEKLPESLVVELDCRPKPKESNELLRVENNNII